MSSSSEPEKRKRCEPGCQCGRHRRGGVVKPVIVAEPDGREAFIPAPPDLAGVLTQAASEADGLADAFQDDPRPEVSVLVPARLDRQRRDLWDFLRPRWEALGYEVVEGSCFGPWRKADAVADALSHASSQILVVADADVWCDGVPAAVAKVKAGAAWAIPHYLVRRLTLPATLEVLASGAWPTRRTTTTYAQPPYPGRPGGGIVVLSRESYERVPLDRRFSGWGQEDESWALALGTLLGKSWRGLADLWHLWHDPAPRQSRTAGNQAGVNLHRRYVTAHRQPKKMAALVAEHRASA